MKTVTIVPTVCKGKAAKWEGSVMLRLPTFDEKYEYIERISIDVDDDGSVQASKAKQIAGVREMVKISQKHYEKVDLKHKETGEVISSFEEMQYSEEMHAVLIEVAGMLLNGFKVGNG
jgi:hypothetical protein